MFSKSVSVVKLSSASLCFTIACLILYVQFFSSLPFEHITFGEGFRPESSELPTIFVFQSNTDVMDFARALGADESNSGYTSQLAQLQVINYQTHVAVLVSRGWAGPYSGIQVNRVRRVGQKIEVHVAFTDRFCITSCGGPAVVLTPYELITVPRSVLPTSPSSYVLQVWWRNVATHRVQ